MKRILSLDGLRGLAVLLVVVSHGTMNVFPGGIGVDIFFVLSGFLITRLLVSENSETGSINYRKFLKRRLIRLYPPLIFTVILAFITSLTINHSTLINLDFIKSSMIALFYASPWFLTFTNWDGSYYRHTWSLGVEEAFYIVWPVVFLLLSRIRNLRTLLLLSVGVITLSYPVFLSASGIQLDNFSSLILRFGGLLLGCALALVEKQPTNNYPLALGCFGIVCALFITMPGLASLVTAFSTTGILWSLSNTGQSETPSFSVRLFTNRVLVWFGKISYELYLVHYVLLIGFIWKCFDIGLGADQIRPWLFLVLGISLLVATLMNSLQQLIRKKLNSMFQVL